MTLRAAFHALCVLVVGLAVTTGFAGAQVAGRAQSGLTRAGRADPTSVVFSPSTMESDTALAQPRLSLWSATIASALVPGLGQLRLNNRRFAGYMAAEALFGALYVKSSRNRDANTSSYKEIARDVARSGFVGAAPPDTTWKYYESLRNYQESGAYSLAASGPTVPETDTTSFNGRQWLLARQQFGVPAAGAANTSAYQAALAYYETRAVTSPYRWSWRNASAQWDAYKQTTELANNAARRATNSVIALIANHVISSVDAFASVRIRQEGSGLRISAAVTTP